MGPLLVQQGGGVLGKLQASHRTRVGGLVIAKQSFFLSTADIGVLMGNCVVFRVDSAIIGQAKFQWGLEPERNFEPKQAMASQIHFQRRFAEVSESTLQQCHRAWEPSNQSFTVYHGVGPVGPHKVKSSYYSPNFIETEPANITAPRSSGAAAGFLWLGASTGIRLPAGLSVQSPALDGSAVTPQISLRDLRLL